MRESSPEPRPPLGSWPRLYAVVIGFLVMDILLLALFSWGFQ